MPPSALRRTLAGWLPVVEYCAEEVRRQGDGPAHVGYMVDAWREALAWTGPLTPEKIALTGAIVAPNVNFNGFRKVGVRVGYDVKPEWQLVPRMIENLCAAPLLQGDAGEFYRQFEEIHPFRDGNGRTGKILFNYLNGTLLEPVWPPNYFGNIENP